MYIDEFCKIPQTFGQYYLIFPIDKFRFLAQEDHFSSCAILSARFPQHYLSIRYRLSSLFLTAAVLDKKQYFRFILISFLHFPTKINIGALLLYLLKERKSKLKYRCVVFVVL